MKASTRAPGYDFFKLIVAIVLLILALILMWVSPPQTSVSLLTTPSATLRAGPTVGPASLTPPPPAATSSPSPSSTGTSTSEPPATPTPSSTSPPSTADASPTGTDVSSPASAAPTATPAPEATIPPGGETSVANVCEAATARSQLQAGTNATILRRLNFRSSPGIRDNWLRTNVPGTQVKVVGGPECVPYWTGAYVWWQIQLPDGSVGWSAEGSLHGSFYFMEPNP